MTLQVTYPYSWIIIAFFSAILVFVGAAFLLKKGFPRRKKTIGAAVTSIVCLAAIACYLASPIRVGVTDTGVTLHCYMSRNLDFRSIKHVLFVESLANSPYSARMRTFGWTTSEFMFGYYILNDGRKAFAMIQGHNPICIIDDGKTVYLVSPPVRYDEFASRVEHLKARYGL